MVIESTKGVVSVDIPSGAPFVTGPEGIRDMRSKLGLAIGDAQTDSAEPQ
jgi:NAD(P)H-hydrate repair Nnr-like enzyme with NAD(P)H-hydrate epimerase domain